ncbi:hypothetical protein OAH34_03365, partial [bacterium]|nr:hypothetical protein [bacterium]
GLAAIAKPIASPCFLVPCDRIIPVCGPLVYHLASIKARMGLHRLTSLVFYLDNNECPLIRDHRWVLPGFEMVLRRMLKSL